MAKIDSEWHHTLAVLIKKQKERDEIIQKLRAVGKAARSLREAFQKQAHLADLRPR